MGVLDSSPDPKQLKAAQRLVNLAQDFFDLWTSLSGETVGDDVGERGVVTEAP